MVGTGRRREGERRRVAESDGERTGRRRKRGRGRSSEAQNERRRAERVSKTAVLIAAPQVPLSPPITGLELGLDAANIEYLSREAIAAADDPVYDGLGAISIWELPRL